MQTGVADTEKGQWSSDWGFWMRTEKKRSEIILVHYSRARTAVDEGSMDHTGVGAGHKRGKGWEVSSHGASDLYVHLC